MDINLSNSQCWPTFNVTLSMWTLLCIVAICILFSSETSEKLEEVFSFPFGLIVTSANRGKYEIMLHQSQPVTHIVVDFRRFRRVVIGFQPFPTYFQITISSQHFFESPMVLRNWILSIPSYDMYTICFCDFNVTMRLDTECNLIRS